MGFEGPQTEGEQRSALYRLLMKRERADQMTLRGKPGEEEKAAAQEEINALYAQNPSLEDAELEMVEKITDRLNR